MIDDGRLTSLARRPAVQAELAALAAELGGSAEPLDPAVVEGFSARANVVATAAGLLRRAGFAGSAADLWPDQPCPYAWALEGKIANPDGLEPGGAVDLLARAGQAALGRPAAKARGGYYTPAPLVEFLWDRAGLAPGTGPAAVFDPAAGGGAFLVEAARRCQPGGRLVGFDVNPFAVFLARASLILAGAEGDGVELGDALGLVAGAAGRGVCPDDIQQPGPAHSRGFETRAKALTTNARVRSKGFSPRLPAPASAGGPILGAFDFVGSNPPYLGEQGHGALFRETLSKYPFWRAHYQARMDYSYWFLILGLLALREGGKLAFLTTAYWPAADGAARLRRFVLDHARVIELIDFGPTRLFPEAPGQHGLGVILERCDDPAAQAKQTMRVVRVRSRPEGTLEGLVEAIRSNPSLALSPTRGEEPARASVPSPFPSGKGARGLGPERGEGSGRIEVFTLRQVELGERPWRLQPGRVRRELARLEAGRIRLGELCEIHQGVVPNPLRLAVDGWRRLPEEFRAGCRPGDGVFVLRPAELARLLLSPGEQTYVKPFVKGSAIGRYVVRADASSWLLYLDDATPIDKLPAIRAHLERFRPLLEARRECRRGRRAWYALHWPRDAAHFEGPKLLAAYRAASARFAFVAEPLYGSTDLYVLTPRPGCPVDLRYLAAILNSSQVSFWLRHNGRSKGELAEQFSGPLAAIPVPLPPGLDGAAAHPRELSRLLAEREAGFRRALAARRGRLVHDGLVRLVDRFVQAGGSDEAAEATVEAVVGELFARLP